MKNYSCVLFLTKKFWSEAMKPSSMKEHVMKKHLDKTNKRIFTT